jgi:hypothetical protein
LSRRQDASSGRRCPRSVCALLPYPRRQHAGRSSSSKSRRRFAVLFPSSFRPISWVRHLREFEREFPHRGLTRELVVRCGKRDSGVNTMKRAVRIPDASRLSPFSQRILLLNRLPARFASGEFIPQVSAETDNSFPSSLLAQRVATQGLTSLRGFREAPSDDPVIHVRSPVDVESHTRRAGETKQPSAITPAEVGRQPGAQTGRHALMWGIVSSFAV